MTTLSQGSIQTFTAPSDGAIVTLSVNGGSSASWSGSAVGSIGPLPGRISIGPLIEGDTVTITANVGECLIAYGDTSPSSLPAVALSQQDVESIQSGAGSVSGLVVSNSNAIIKWRRARSRQRQAISNAVILLLGDSVLAGSGSNGTTGYGANQRATNWAVLLAAKLNALGIAARADSVFGAAGQSNYPLYDNRVSVTVPGWSFAMTLNGLPGGSFRSTTNGAALAWTPTSTWDTAKVWYASSSSQGSFNVNIDGGANTLVNASNATAAIGSVTLTAASVGTHTLNVIKSGTTTVQIVGFEFSDSTKKEIQIIQMGFSGAKALDFVSTSNPWDAGSLIQSLTPDLTIISLNINDWNAPTTLGDTATAGTYIHSLQAIINSAQVSGDAMLLTGDPSAVASYASLATQQTYVDAQIARAAAQGAEALDIWRGIGSYEAATGFYVDTLHPGPVGTDDKAERVKNEILIA